MRITNGQLGTVFQAAQRTGIASQGLLVAPHRAKSNPTPSTKCLAAPQDASDIRGQINAAKCSDGEQARGSGNSPGLAASVMKYAFAVGGAAHLYNKAANDCCSLHYCETTIAKCDSLRTSRTI